MCYYKKINKKTQRFHQPSKMAHDASLTLYNILSQEKNAE